MSTLSVINAAVQATARAAARVFRIEPARQRRRLPDGLSFRGLLGDVFLDCLRCPSRSCRPARLRPVRPRRQTFRYRLRGASGDATSGASAFASISAAASPSAALAAWPAGSRIARALARAAAASASASAASASASSASASASAASAGLPGSSGGSSTRSASMTDARRLKVGTATSLSVRVLYSNENGIIHF